MIQYIILGYLLYEILRLAQRPDISDTKFSTPDDGAASAPAAPVAPMAPTQMAPPPPPATTSPEAPKSEENTAKSG